MTCHQRPRKHDKLKYGFSDKNAASMFSTEMSVPEQCAASMVAGKCSGASEITLLMATSRDGHFK